MGWTWCDRCKTTGQDPMLDGKCIDCGGTGEIFMDDEHEPNYTQEYDDYCNRQLADYLKENAEGEK